MVTEIVPSIKGEDRRITEGNGSASVEIKNNSVESKYLDSAAVSPSGNEGEKAEFPAPTVFDQNEDGKVDAQDVIIDFVLVAGQSNGVSTLPPSVFKAEKTKSASLLYHIPEERKIPNKGLSIEA